MDEPVLPGLGEAIGKAITKWGRDHRLAGLRPGEHDAMLRVVARTLLAYSASLAGSVEKSTGGKAAMTEEEFLTIARQAWAARGGG